jgi:outer membrane protein OmpA-like peptidoglycan-associated protein
MVRVLVTIVAAALTSGVAGNTSFASSYDPPVVSGCSDGTREGYLNLGTHPQIAGCSGGWTVPGIRIPKLPTCGRESGNCSDNLEGRGCAAEDLCAPGWHICADGLEVRRLSSNGCGSAVPSGKGRFFATRQGGTGDSNCGYGANDVYGCGTIGAAIWGTGCSVLNRFSNNNCSGLPAPWSCYGEVNEALNVVKPGVERGGVLCCKDPDADGDGIPDTIEDPNDNDVVDPGETDSKDPDTDGDGLTDGEEDKNLNGVWERGETDPTNADTDRDGLTDGTELGVDSAGNPIPGANKTNPLSPDTDRDGLRDGLEDANRNGKRDVGETDPAHEDTDRDGLVDGWVDTDGDGYPSPAEGEDLDRDGKVDNDETDPRLADTDGGGESDGSEVLETGHDPLDPSDDWTGPGDDDAGAGSEDAGTGGSGDAGGSTADGGTSDAGVSSDGGGGSGNDAGVGGDGGSGGGDGGSGGGDGGSGGGTGGDGGASGGDSGASGGDGGSGGSGSQDDNLTDEDGKLRFVGGGCAIDSQRHLATPVRLSLFALLALGVFALFRRRRRVRRSSGTKRAALLTVALVVTVAGSQARAQNQFSVLRMRPAASPLNYYNTEGAKTLPHLSPSVGLYLHYDHDPLQVRDDATGESLYDEVSYQLNMELLAAIGFWDRLELGFALPVTLTQDEGDRPAAAGGSRSLTGGIGDLRLIPKVRLFTFGPLSAAVAVSIELPTGNNDNFLGDDGVGVDPRVAFGLDWDRFGGALNVGVRIRPEADVVFSGTSPGSAVDDELFISAGARAGLWPERIDAIIDGYAFVGLHETTQSRTGGEILAGVRGYLPYGLTANLAAGPGIGRGVGTPAFRVLAGLHYQYQPPREDEVMADVPVTDLDSDGIPDERDRCPSRAEDMDQFEDEDGCPDLDNDHDGLPDSRDDCPNEREDIDGFEDADGCPDLDNDQDGISDTDDRCPMHPETINQLDDEDGCPDSTQGAVQLKHDRITVPAVHFAVGKVRIMPQSQEILEMVAQLLADNSWIKRVRIEGHTDSTGGAAYNQKLSEGRVSQVQYFLMQQGIAASRLDAVGFGETRPVADNGSANGRARNRRVEFVIVDPPSQR